MTGYVSGKLGPLFRRAADALRKNPALCSVSDCTCNAERDGLCGQHLAAKLYSRHRQRVNWNALERGRKGDVR